MTIDNAWQGQSRGPADAAGGERCAPHEQRAAAPRPPRTSRTSRAVLTLVCVWSLVEIPFEWSPPDGAAQFAALLVAKCLLVGIGAAAFIGLRYARALFAFVCGAGALAVSSTLPFVYHVSHPLFVIALAECVLKTLFLIVCAGEYLTLR
jgi:hypothetical protein